MTALCTVTYCRRPLWVRAVKPLRVAMLKREIASAEGWIAHVEDGGVYDAREIAHLWSAIGPTRALLAWWVAA